MAFIAKGVMPTVVPWTSASVLGQTTMMQALLSPSTVRRPR